MSDRFNRSNNFANINSMKYSNDMKIINNMESAHQRKKAAFDELLRYTYSNLKETKLDNTNNKQS